MIAKDTNNVITDTQELLLQAHVLRLAMFADLVDRFIDIYLKGKANWLMIFLLTMLIMAGGTATPTELRKLMYRPKDSIIKLINNLVREGYVKRVRGGKDRRNVQIVVTQEGINYVTRTVNLVKRDEEMMKTSFNPKHLEIYFEMSKHLGTWFSERIKSVSDNNFQNQG